MIHELKFKVALLPNEEICQDVKQNYLTQISNVIFYLEKKSPTVRHHIEVVDNRTLLFTFEVDIN